LFRYSDAGWHIRTGESILSTRRFPYRSIFLHPVRSTLVRLGVGFGCVDGAVYGLGGLSAVAMLYGLAVAGSVWLWFRLNGC